MEIIGSFLWAVATGAGFVLGFGGAIWLIFACIDGFEAFKDRHL